MQPVVRNPPPLLLPQRRRIHRQTKQREVVRQRVLQDGVDDVRRQRGQIHHPAHVAVVDAFLRTLKAEYFHLATLDGLHDLEAGVNDYIYYYNREHIKLGLKGLRPVEYRLVSSA